jgi:hypothetical protein
VGIGKGVSMSARHFNALVRMGDDLPALPAKDKLIIVRGFFLGFILNQVFGARPARFFALLATFDSSGHEFWDHY